MRLAVAIVVFVVWCLASFLSVSRAYSHDHSRPELDDWYMSLKSRKGPCCGGPKVDATTLSDTQWRRKGQIFEVYVDSQWVDVPEEAMLYQENRAGVVLVWVGYNMGRPWVRCFLPGTLS